MPDGQLRKKGITKKTYIYRRNGKAQRISGKKKAPLFFLKNSQKKHILLVKTNRKIKNIDFK